MSSDDVAAAKERLRTPLSANRLLTIRLIPDRPIPRIVPVEVWTAHLGREVSAGDELPLDVLAELAVALEGTDGWELSSTRKYIEWGGSAVSVEVLLQIAEWVLQGVAGGLAYDGLRRTVLRLVNDSSERLAKGGAIPREPMTADEAANLGRWKLRSAFGVSDEDSDKLNVVGEDRRSDGSRVIRYELGDRRYEVEMVERDGLFWIARAGWQERERRPNDD
jgi:hypothetical protein